MSDRRHKKAYLVLEFNRVEKLDGTDVEIVWTNEKKTNLLPLDLKPDSESLKKWL